jgi:hypothetical protein
MDIMKMLSELRAERQQIDEAILVLQRLGTGQPRGRGRPPKWMSSPTVQNSDEGIFQKRRPFSAATKAKMAASQKKRWAAKKKQETD